MRITQLYKRLKKSFSLQRKRRSCSNPKYNEPRLHDLVSKEAVLLNRYIKHDSIVLDAGCGDGRNSFRLVDELGLRPYLVVMLDNNLKPLDKVRSNIRAAPDTAFIFNPLHGSIFDIPCFDNGFDASIALGDVVCYGIRDSIKEALRELCRVTRHQGVLIFSVVNKEYLIQIAYQRNQQAKAKEVNNMLLYTQYDSNYEVVRCVDGKDGLVKIMKSLRLDLQEILEVSIDYREIVARFLVVASKV